MDLTKPKSSTCPRLSQSRSRRPLSADDVPMLEELLSKQSLNSQSSMYINSSHDSGFHSQFSPLSTDSLSRVQGDILQFLIEEGENQLFADETANISSSTTDQSAMEVFEKATRDGSTTPAVQIKKSVSMDFIFSEISEELGHVWERLGRYLLKRECLVRNINRDFDTVKEKAFQVLMRWKRDQGSEATIEALMASLVRVECAKIAESLLNYLDLSSQLAPRSRTASAGHVPAPKIVYNVAEDPDSFMIQRRLSHSSEEKVFLWTHNISCKKYVIKEIEGKSNVWTARRAIDCKTLQCRKLSLRKTEDFIKDLQAKERMVKYLLGVVEHLQNHLSTHHTGFCQKGTKCQHCPRVGLKRDLIHNELALLQHELQRVITAGNRRISVSGIPTDRIYSIAERTYTVCEEHKALHEQARSQKCADTISSSWDEDEDDERIEKSLKCTLNIMFTIGRRRKSVQSLKLRKQNKERKKVKRNKSTFYVPLKRESYLWAQESPVMIGEWDPKDPGPAERNPSATSEWEPCLLQDLCETTEKTASLRSCQRFDCDVRKLEKFRERRRTSERFTKQKTPTRTQSCSGVALGPQGSKGTPSQSSSSRGVFTRQSFPPVQGSGCTPWSHDLHGEYGELLLDEVEDPHEGRLESTGDQTSKGELGGAIGGSPGSGSYATCEGGLAGARSASLFDSPTSHFTDPTQSSSSSSSSRLGATPQHNDKSCRRRSMELSSLQDIQWMQDLDCSEIICV